MTDRRTFLRRSLRGAVGAAAWGSAACTPDTPGARSGAAGGQASGTDTRSNVTRPLLRPWASDIVWLDAPGQELPVAYVSMALRQVFVDYDFRDRAAWLLRAHISVSTALWRIPLPGDPPRQPIQPGDEAREFEELPIRAWDPSHTPEIDDVRIVRGTATHRAVEFACVPLVDGAAEAWLAGGPFEIAVSDGSATGSIREDFRIVGTGLTYADRACSTSGDAVQYISWASGG